MTMARDAMESGPIQVPVDARAQQRWRRPGAFLLAFVLTLSSAIAAGAHTGSHWTGAETDSRYDGAIAWIKTTNASPRSGTDDAVYNRINGSNSNQSAYLMVGWAETGTNGRRVFTSSSSGGIEFYQTLSSGSHVDVRLVSAPDCVIGEPPCRFKAQIWNHTTETWDLLRQETLATDRMYLEELTVVYVDSGGSDFAIDTTNNNLEWVETQRRLSDGSWHLWGTSSTVIQDSGSTYCTDWDVKYHDWDARKGGC